MLLKRFFLASLVFFCTGNALANKDLPTWQFEVGASAGRPTPIMLNAGVGYKNLFFRAMGGGLYFKTDDFWIGFRGGLDWKFFRELPFSLDLGMSSGYAFAKAPNGYHKALNRANKQRILRSYNYKESLDISVEMRANFYGVFTQVAVPVIFFMRHDEPNVIWQVGYAYSF